MIHHFHPEACRPQRTLACMEALVLNDHKEQQWQPMPPMKHPRAFAGAVVLREQEIVW